MRSKNIKALTAQLDKLLTNGERVSHNEERPSSAPGKSDMPTRTCKECTAYIAEREEEARANGQYHLTPWPWTYPVCDLDTDKRYHYDPVRDELVHQIPGRGLL